MSSLAQLIVQEIVKQNMLQAYSSNPDVTFTFEFKANAVEQLDALITEYLFEGGKTYLETAELLEKSPKVFVRALSIVMEEHGMTRERALEWLADDSDPCWQ